MLYLKLCTPVIIDSQIPEIAKDYGLNESELYEVLNGSKLYFRKKDGTFADHAMTYVEAEELGLTEANSVFGVSAILQRCHEIGPELTTITEINIPADLYIRSCKLAWDDICYLFSRVENRNNRLQTLIECKAPKIILRNEERMLIDYIEQLEHNNLYRFRSDEPKHLLRADGRIYRALNDVGYSIIHGWDKEVQEQMEKEFQQFMNSIESDTDSESAGE